MSEYSGEDRRRIDRDHDLLLEIRGIVTAHQESSRKLDEAFIRHVQDDATSFGKLWKAVSGIRWYVAMGMGVVIALEFAVPYILKKGN